MQKPLRTENHEGCRVGDGEGWGVEETLLGIEMLSGTTHLGFILNPLNQNIQIDKYLKATWENSNGSALYKHCKHCNIYNGLIFHHMFEL